MTTGGQIPIEKHLAKNLFMLRSVMHIVPKWALRTLYYSYIHSNFMYGLSVWGPLVLHVLKSNLNLVKVFQKKALRNIECAKYNACTKELCKKTEIFLIDELIELELAKISYRYTHDALAKPLRNLFQANDYNHNYMIRARHNPRIQPHSSNIYYTIRLMTNPRVWFSEIGP